MKRLLNCNEYGLLWEQVPFYLAELTEKTGEEDRIEILKVAQAKSKVLLITVCSVLHTYLTLKDMSLCRSFFHSVMQWSLYLKMNWKHIVL